MRISLSMIVRDEAAGLPETVESAKSAVDEMVFVDTGSADDTLLVCKRYSEKVYVHPEAARWRENPAEFSFAEARNYALDRCTGDWILSLDADETLPPEVAAKLAAVAEATPAEVELILMHLRMCRDDGTAYQQFLAERLFRRLPHIRWAGAMHNWVESDPTKRLAWKDGWIVHNRRRKPNALRAARNDQRLAMAERHYGPLIEANPRDRRSLFYLAGTYFDAGQTETAIGVYERYLEVSDFPEERYQAAILLAQCYARKGAVQQAQMVLARHILDNWRRAEALVMLGELALSAGDWAQAEWWFKAASLKEMPVDPMFVECDAHTWEPHAGLWRAYIGLGDHGKAAYHGQQAVELGAPNAGEIVKWEKEHVDYRSERIVVVADRGQTNFVEPLVQGWRAEGREVRVVSEGEWERGWPDIVWFEWAGDECVKFTNLTLSQTQGGAKPRVIVRVHGYETHSGHIGQVNWRVVDDVIFVADYLRDLALAQAPQIGETCNVHVVPGGIETQKFAVAEGRRLTPGLFLTRNMPKLSRAQLTGIARTWSRPYEYSWIAGQLAAGEAVLDFGAGRSAFAGYIAALGCHVTRQDVDPEAMAEMQAADPETPTVCGSDLGESLYDVVVSCSVMEHIKDREQALASIYRALREGGRLVMTFDVPRVDVREMREMLLAVGFSVGEMPDAPPPDAVGAAWRKRGWKAEAENPQLRVYAVTAYKARVKQGNKIAMACHLNAKKNLPMALQILAALPAEYELHIAGEWQDHRLAMYVEHMIESLDLRGRLRFHEWQSDLNAFYADKDYYLSASIEESFHYSLAEAMAAGLKPVIHDWRSARDFYRPEWIFKTIGEATRMVEIPPTPEERASYRQYAVDSLDFSLNRRRIGRIIRRPSVGICGEPKYRDAFENKLAAALVSLGCRVDKPSPEVAILLGHEPRIEPWMDGCRKLLWAAEYIGNDPATVARKEKMREVVPRVDLVLANHASDIPIYRELGAKRVEHMTTALACPPFARLHDEPKQYDVGFYGEMSKRRERIINLIGERLEDTQIAVYSTYDHSDLNRFINRCKVMLNVHYTDEPYFSSRIVECAAAGACVVSERLPAGHDAPVVEAKTADGLYRKIKVILRDGTWQERGRAAERWARNGRSLAGQAERILEMMGV